MTPSQIRNELLTQHGYVRARIDALRLAAERWAHGEPGREEMKDALRSLRETVRTHNRQEERLLRDILPHVDAWGPVRAEIMLEEHAKEHAELYAVLISLATVEDPQVAAREVATLVDHMLRHMTREETLLLGEDVLHDDQIVRDSFGG